MEIQQAQFSLRIRKKKNLQICNKVCNNLTDLIFKNSTYQLKNLKVRLHINLSFVA